MQGVLSLGLLTLSALIPTATADLVKRGSEVIVEYYTRYTVRSLAIALPMFGALCVSVPYLLVAWLGEMPPELDRDRRPALARVLGQSSRTGVAMTLVVSDGHPGMVAQTAILVVVLNVASTLVAAPLFGLWGVLLATVAAELIAATVFLIRFHRRYALGAAQFRAAVDEADRGHAARRGPVRALVPGGRLPPRRPNDGAGREPSQPAASTASSAGWWRAGAGCCRRS